SHMRLCADGKRRRRCFSGWGLVAWSVAVGELLESFLPRGVAEADAPLAGAFALSAFFSEAVAWAISTEPFGAPASPFGLAVEPTASFAAACRASSACRACS